MSTTRSRPLLDRYYLDDGKAPRRYYPVSSYCYGIEKITAERFFLARLERAGVPYGSLTAAYLMGAPLDAERPSLSERVRVAGDGLARRAHKFLTLAKEYTERERFRHDMDNPPANVLPSLASLGTRRLPTAPFESGRNTLPGMERFAS